MARYASTEPPPGYFLASTIGGWMAGKTVNRQTIWLQVNRETGDPRVFTKRYIAVEACIADEAAQPAKKRG